MGDAALSALRTEGVDVRGVLRGGERIGIYFVEPGADLRPLRVVYDRAGSAFSQIEPATIDWSAVLRGADWFHVSGITAALGEGPRRCAQGAVEAARALGVRVSVDLNYRPALWAGRDPAPVVQPLVHRADLLIGNPGAVTAMLGIKTAGVRPEPPEALRKTAERLAGDFGIGRAALTQRESLSASEHGWSAALYVASAGEFCVSRRYQVRLVDRVGGGDSFAAALLFALLDVRTEQSALNFAIAASALKLTIPGDFNRVSAQEVDSLLHPNG